MALSDGPATLDRIKMVTISLLGNGRGSHLRCLILSTALLLSEIDYLSLQ